MRRTRSALLLASIVVVWACGEGLGPDAGTVPLDVAPSFQLLPGTFESPPIDRVVLEVTNLTTSQIVATADVTVDPNADSWSIPLSVDLGDEDAIYVLVQILLYSGSTVAWSGREGPILVTAGQAALARSVQVFRGPLDNLDVTSVTILNAPAGLTVGQSVSLSASLTLVPGSTASPEVFWASSDTTIATVTDTGSTVTLTAVSAGTADIIAAAGAAYDEFTVQINAGVPAGFDTQWEGTTSDWYTASNWSAGQVPLATDNVYIPASAVDPVLSGSATVSDLTVASGATLDFLDALLTVSGDLDAGTTITGGGSVELTGSGTTLQGAIQPQLIVTGTVSTSGAVTMSDLMTVDGSLTVGAHSFAVGDVWVNGTLSVSAGGTLGSSGTLTLSQGSTLDVDGTVTATNGCIDLGATITGSGTHPCGGSVPAGTKTWVGGDAAGATGWHNANNWNPPGEPGAGDTVVVAGTTSYYPVMSTDVNIAALSVGSPVTVDLGGGSLFVAGDVDVSIGGGLVNGFTVVTGTGTMLHGTFDNLDIQADRAASGQMIVFGNLSVSGARFDAAAQSVTVGGNLDVSGPGAALVMNTPTSQAVSVSGDALFNGGDETGLLTEGTLQIGGDLTATDASAGSFVASGNHLLHLFGSSTQNVQFQIPATQRANDVTIASLVGASFQSDATMVGNVTLLGTASLPSSYTVNVLGDLTLQNGSVFRLDGAINIAGACTSSGIVFGTGTWTPLSCITLSPVDQVWVGGDAVAPSDWQIANNWLPAGVPTDSTDVLVPYTTNAPTLSANAQVGALTVALSASINENSYTLTVNGNAVVDGSVTSGLTVVAAASSVQGYFQDLQIDAAVTLSDLLYAVGNLDVRAPLSVGPFPLYVGLDLTVQGVNGVLTMKDPASALYVDGNATFDGASSVGQLTDGAMILYGDLSVFSTNSPTSFQSTGTGTFLYGSVDQTVGFDNPGLSGQFLEDLFVYQPQGVAVIFNTDVTATGIVSGSSGTTVLRQGGRSTLEVTGELRLDGATFDGLPLRLVSSVSPEIHQMDNVTFANYQTSDTQLYVELPGADVNMQFLLNSPVFSTQPTTGYYIHAVNATVGGPILAVELISPTPVGGLNYVLQGTNTVVLWP